MQHEFIYSDQNCTQNETCVFWIYGALRMNKIFLSPLLKFKKTEQQEELFSFIACPIVNIPPICLVYSSSKAIKISLQWEFRQIFCLPAFCRNFWLSLKSETMVFPLSIPAKDILLIWLQVACMLDFSKVDMCKTRLPFRSRRSLLSCTVVVL